MTYSQDHIALAAEYALGTLDADERALVETMMIVDQGFKEEVEAWDRKLSPLHQMVGAVEPPAHVWDKIKDEVGLTGKPISAPLPQYVPPVEVEDEEPRHAREEPPVYTPASAHLEQELERLKREREIAVSELALARSAPEIVVAPPSSPQPSAQSNVVELSNRRRGGRAFGYLMTAVAAALAAVVSLQAYRPDLLPAELRVKPKIQTVEVKTPAPPAGAQFVALLQQDVALPAFILTVDTNTKNFTVRKVGAKSEPGKSYELWLVSDTLNSVPRSLGLIGNSDFTVRPALAAYDIDTINKATYAVTVEPEGGAPTGKPTTAPVFTGKLVESVPALPTK